MPPDEQINTQVQQLPPGVLAAIVIVYLVVLVVMIASLWKLFSKAGEPGWAAIIPIYNTIVFLKIGGKPWWWLFLFCIPIAGLVFAILALVTFTERYGKGAGYVIGILLFPLTLIFLPMLAFGDSKYLGPKAV